MHNPSAIDVKHLAGHETRAIGCKKEQSAGDILWVPSALQGLMIEHKPGVSFRIRMNFFGIRRKCTGANSVYRDAKGAEFSSPGPS